MNIYYVCALLSVVVYAIMPSIIKHIGDNIPPMAFIAYILYLNSAKNIPVVDFELIRILSSIIAGIIGYIFLKELISINQIIGFLIMCIGFYISIK